MEQVSIVNPGEVITEKWINTIHIVTEQITIVGAIVMNSQKVYINTDSFIK
jgi:hypothetical protein